MAGIQWKLPETLLPIYEYWRGKRAGADLPSRSRIDPDEVPHLKPYLMILQAIGGGEDFRYRFMGDAVIQATGVDCTGKRMTEVLRSGPYLDYLLGLNREVVAERRALYSESSFRSDRLSNRWTCRVILPLSQTGRSVDGLVAAQVFGGLSQFTPAPPFSEMVDFEEGVRVPLD